MKNTRTDPGVYTVTGIEPNFDVVGPCVVCLRRAHVRMIADRKWVDARIASGAVKCSACFNDKAQSSVSSDPAPPPPT